MDLYAKSQVSSKASQKIQNQQQQPSKNSYKQQFNHATTSQYQQTNKNN